MSYRESHSKLIQYAGGIVENDLFVSKFGVKLITETKSVIPPDILDVFQIDKSSSESHNILELNSKITFMNCNKKDDNYVERLYNDLGHTSISSNFHVGFLVAGVTGETLLEFVSSVANISRLTTSRTMANKDTLYLVEDEIDKLYVEKFIELRRNYLISRSIKNKDPLDKDEIEKRNRFNLFTKVLSFTISMSLDNWKWYLDKKINSDYELEFKKVCIEIRDILIGKYSSFIK